MLAEKNICTGCGACAAGCPLNCIKMSGDREGFCYPVVDTERCVSCKKCESVCPVLNRPQTSWNLKAYGAKLKDDAIRKESSSGGVFSSLAYRILQNGGAVCGAAYTGSFEVEHRIVEKQDEVYMLRGAKYAQSRAEHLFEEAKFILETDRWLLFAGTPCQIAGFRAYLGKDYPKLVLVDMICHGVPSPGVWKKYLENRIKKDTENGKIIRINQRDKTSGWSRYRYSLRIDYTEGKTYCVPQSEDLYMKGFVNNLFLRPSCAQCQFKGENRSSDITLGDYWGVWEQYPEFDDDKGISVVLINTEKGAKLWDLIREDLNDFDAGDSEALKNNPSAFYSSDPHPRRNEFFARTEDSDFEDLVTELLYGKPASRFSVRNLLQKIIKH